MPSAAHSLSGNGTCYLVFVADLAKRGVKEGQQVTDTDLLSSWANTGFMAQNVYLWCASEGMSTVIRAMIPRDKLAPEIGLKPLQRIILAQTVGFPLRNNLNISLSLNPC